MHIDDAVGAFLHALDDERVVGAINVTAPAAVTNAQFSRALARRLGRPAVVPVPPILLKLRFGEGAAVLTTGQRVLPSRTEATGYFFHHGQIEEALDALFV